MIDDKCTDKSGTGKSGCVGGDKGNDQFITSYYSYMIDDKCTDKSSTGKSGCVRGDKGND